MNTNINLRIIRELSIISVLIFLLISTYKEPEQLPLELFLISIIYMTSATMLFITQKLSNSQKSISLISLFFIYTYCSAIADPSLFNTAMSIHIIGIIVISLTIHSIKSYFFIASIFLFDTAFNFFIYEIDQFYILSIVFILTAYFSSTFTSLLHNLYTKIDTLSKTDDFTGLLNQKGFLEQLEKEFYRSKRYNKTFILMMLDSDELKKVNETHGHQYGSMVIKMVSEVINANTRRTDFSGRYGGDEFMVCLVESTKKDGILFAERIRKTIEMKSLFTSKGKELAVTVSVGVSSFPESGNELYDIIEKADKALYLAKDKGKNNVQYM